MSPAFDVPRIRSGAVERPRLMTALGTDGDRPVLAIVQGQAGSGKSTALAQWARTLTLRDEDLVWVTLHSDDEGVLSFWRRVGSALTRAGLLGADTPLDASVGDLTTMLLGALGALEQPLTLVLDDYHQVAGEHIDAQLRLLLEKLGGLRVVIGTRTTNDLHSLVLAARVDTLLVGADALAFTLEESRELVTAGGLSDRTDLATGIHTATRGWPLASQALIVEAQRDPDLAGLLSQATRGSVAFAREFAQSVLRARPPGSRDFLLRVSLTDECTVDLASELTGEKPSSTKALLDALEHDGIGTWQMRSGMSWFRMHPLLGEAFEVEAMALLDADVVRRLRGTLSDRLENDRPLRALELAFAIGDWSRVERLTLLHWHGFNYYDRAPYGRLLSRVPRSAMRAHPVLLAAEIVHDYNSVGTLERMQRNFSVVSVAAQSRGATAGVLGALAEIMYGGTHRLMADMPTALTKVELAQAILSSSDALDRERHATAIPTLHAHVGITHFFGRQYLRGLDDIAMSNAAATDVGSVSERFQALAVTALIHASRGDIVQARQWLRRCEEADPYGEWIGGYLQAGYHIAKATSALQNWESESALEALEVLTPSEPVFEWWPLIAVARAYADALAFGPGPAYATLAETLVRKRSRPRAVPSLTSQLTAMAARLLLLDGQAGRAAATIRDSGVGDEPEVVLVSARLASLRGEHDAAIGLADSVAWSSDESPGLRADALLTLASCAFEAGQHDRAVTTFASAMTTLARHDLRTPLLWIGRSRLAELATLAREHGSSVDEGILDAVPDLGRAPVRALPLSRAERRVLQTVRDTGDVTGTAELLHLAEGTVRYHLKRIYRKLGVSNRSDAIAVAQELGMLTGPLPSER